MHIGFTYPSIMSAFKNHCIELIGKNSDEFKLFMQFIWGIKVYKLDELNNEFLKMRILFENSSDISLSSISINFLDDDEKEDFVKKGNNPLKFFCAIDTEFNFIDIFIKRLQIAKEEEEDWISIGSMAVRADMIEEYGWDYPNKIPDVIKKLSN